MGFETKEGPKVFFQNIWNKITQFHILKLHYFIIILLHLEYKKVY
jgi:hypothetical protein